MIEDGEGNVSVRKVLIEKALPTFKIIRVIDFDGMGGKEYIYHCGYCRREVQFVGKCCKWCGTYLDGLP